MSRPSWYERAARVVDAAISEGRAAGLEGKALVAFVDARYPFGPRENFPYRMWLKARRELLFGKRTITEGEKALTPLPGQLELFEEPKP